MKLQDILGGMFVLIFAFLLLNRSADTAKVINTLSTAVTNDTLVLQGRGSGTIQNTSTAGGSSFLSGLFGG